MPGQGRSDLLVTHELSPLEQYHVAIGRQQAARVPARIVTPGVLQQSVMQFIRVHEPKVTKVCQYASIASRQAPRNRVANEWQSSGELVVILLATA